MNFRTEIEITKSSKSITYHHKTMFVGSCFATNMGEMVFSKFFPTLVNPFGVLFNPVSVADGIRILIQNKTFTQADLNFHNELWFSYKHHTSFSSPQADECLKKINTAVNHASLFLQKSDFLFITFGTAWIYELIQTGEVVSNCHKIKASNFKRRLLTINEIVKQYNELVEELRMFNPKLSIIFTVSPVRHLKDSAHGNQLSKSVLLLAIDELCKNQYFSYFPSYEIVLDELRDYRFFDKDMVHPNSLAIEYVWEKFRYTFFDESTLQILADIESLKSAAAHRPFNANTETHRKFLQSYLLKIQKMKQLHPYINLNELENYFTVS